MHWLTFSPYSVLTFFRTTNPLTLMLAILVITTSPANRAGAAEPTLVSARKIWERAPHNAFTGLIQERGQFLCVFREGQRHVSPDGSIRVLTSSNGQDWTSLALLTSTNADLRDPKITKTPDGRLMICAAGAMQPPSTVRHQSMVWYSKDGRDWDGPINVGEPNQWMWRIRWQGGKAYGVGYETAGEKFVRLYASGDGRQFKTIVPKLHDAESPNETGLEFLPDGRAVCLLRRDGQPGHGLLGTASPPFTTWDWKDIGQKIGGPDLLRLPDGRLLAGGRLYEGKVRMSLGWIDLSTGHLTEFLALPSGGDCSYPGLVWDRNTETLWVSYYSSHEGKTSIYLAQVRIPKMTQ